MTPLQSKLRGNDGVDRRVLGAVRNDLILWADGYWGATGRDTELKSREDCYTGWFKLDRTAARYLLPLLLPAAVAHLWAAWRPLPALLTKFVGDDMFYYLQIARNIARGAGATFDGETLTNGFHPV